MGVQKKKVFRYSNIFIEIFPFLRYLVNKFHPVKIENIVQTEFIF